MRTTPDIVGRQGGHATRVPDRLLDDWLLIVDEATSPVRNCGDVQRRSGPQEGVD